MRFSARPFALLALIALPTAASEVQVRVNGGLVDVVATAAPLQEVLAQLSRQTGMKVVYDGAAPRTLLTVTLPQRTPVEAVLGLFEGLSLNYAIKTDPSGTRIDTLIVSSAPSAGGSAARAPQPAPGPQQLPAFRPPAPTIETQPAEDEQEEEAQDQEEQPEQKAQPTPVPPFSFSDAIPGPGKPGSPFGGGQVGPLTLPTPPPVLGIPAQGSGSVAPGAPAPTPTASPSAPSQ